MNIRDPFLRSILVVTDRIAVYLVLSAIVFCLLWELVSRYALRVGPEETARMVIAFVIGTSSPCIAGLLVLTMLVACLSVAIVCYALFSVWRRRARVQSGYVRGPYMGGDS